eukprot:CAMPEP_0113437430 /NCGR_PEP_ID=MMETSP0013_2-20120614/37420_1 /TAXON_ID=2843 ORGANISM="Skeletonema costatum, Strain 1716" /NCGR_SAMPLE_ID=MMETSP0013_2 /ASSEMBLY_ACC=CAM_ASM_000158 /LENGTH=425 /DNA_ID=CAMNT_0000328101 /DNA_START=320 /DNA_END=1597 /DNA_ORIENTATION=- /assembly_acc=CAM_ASM_000158
MKLIHSGKVLKDDATIESCNIKPSDFLVVMIAKAKKTAAAAAAAPKPAAPKEEVKPAAAPAAPTAAASTAASTTTTAAAPAPSATTTESSSAADDEFPTEVINNLKALGFPESDCRACLRASNGNPDVAVEFLMNGIPPGISASTAAGSSSAGASSSSSSTTTTGTGALEALRHHPQFNDLKRLVQTNPNMLSAVLQQIGQQQPELLQAINANQAEFLQMMNEPVGSTGGSGGLGGGGAANPAPAAGANNNNPFSGSSAAAASNAMPPGMEALGNPAQLAAMLQSMPPQEQHAMASMMGMTVDQLQQTAQMISAMPQEQVQQYMNMAMQGAGGPGMGGMMGGAGGMGGGGGAGAQVLRLSEEEMAAVNRLTEMGFDRAAAAQAYLACDKNEALAANLLMDGGFADFGDDGADMGGGGGGDDDMYD